MKNTSQKFIALSLFSLLFGLLFGCLGASQYAFPEFLKTILSFEKIRPLHVTLVLSFIVLCATGVVYFAIETESKKSLKPGSGKFHFYLYFFTGITILITYCMGIFGGREYLEFTPVLLLPILLGWFIMTIHYFRNFLGDFKQWQVYHWMWATGLFFMIFTLSESQLWLFSYYSENVVRDITVQWKSYGAMIGSWNMLVYGTGLFLMNKMKPAEGVARGFMPFALYFLGLFNLMFGWAHHTYIVPAAPWVRHIAYFVSMTELLILAKIIYQWRKSWIDSRPLIRIPSFKFLWSADIWIFLNLVLAMIISIPAINFYTHGTHFTVAHAMGTTIGINTNILLAAVFYILSRKTDIAKYISGKLLGVGILIFQLSLMVLWLNLMWMGYQRSLWMNTDTGMAFRELQHSLLPNHILFLFAGIGIFTGLILILLPALKMVFIKQNQITSSIN